MAELPTINLALYAQTDVGMVRSGNEDNFLILDLSSGRSWTASEEEPQDLLTYSQGYYGTMLAVSDGMGGALAGEVASRMAVETVRDRMLQLQAHDLYGKLPFHERLRLAIEEANLLINGESQTNPAHKGLGATFTAVAAIGAQVYFGQVGDSRAYLIRHEKIYRITKDQSLVQQLIDAGQITEEEAETHSYRNVILQALGAHNNVNVEVNSLTLCNLDTLVLCSDGLSGKLHQEEIARIVQEASDFKSACQRLIDLANERGGEDNITVVIAQFSGSSLTLPKNDMIEPQSLARSPDTPTEINWGVGAPTDPLYDSSNSSGDFPNAESKATEPLTTPPSQSMPFTAKIQRSASEISRTNDLSDRRGPITSVFAPEDFDAEPVSTTQQHSAKTEPLESRNTKPINPQTSAINSTPALPGSTADGSKPGDTSNSGGLKANAGRDQTNSKNGQSRRNLVILAGLIVLGIGGAAIGVTTYFKQQAQARDAHQAQMKLKLEEKEGKIGLLREKMAEINRRLEALDRPALNEKRKLWSESLDRLRQQLDDASKMPLEQLPEISQTCDKVQEELKKIEDEVSSLQGLLPTPEINREPIKV
ncbi:MAG: protein phosphatase 2C domain-containing protein [Blastocatellales bacterium]